MKKRTVAAMLILTLLLGFLPSPVRAAESTPAAFGWETDGNDFTGWVATDESIIGTFAPTHTSRIWKQLEDVNDFKLTVTLQCDNTTSPYIQVAGVIVELDANNGNGNQVFPKINGTGNSWMDAQECTVTVTINRYNGGPLTITLNGRDNETPVVLTAACGSGNDAVEIGMYRGGFVTIRDYSVTTPDQTQSGDPGESDAGPGLEPAEKDSEVWILGENWAVNEEDSALILTQASGGTALLREMPDLTQDLDISVDWVLNTTIDTNNTWAEKVAFCLHDPESEDYLFIRFHRYRSGGGIYQIYISAQWWNSDKNEWSAQALDVWTSKMSGAVLSDVKLHLIRDASEEALRIRIDDNADGTLLGSAVLKASAFGDSTVAEKFTRVILNGTQVPFAIGCDGNSAPYYLRDPQFGLPEKEIRQTLFTADTAWKAELDDSGSLAFCAQRGAYGWMEYNAGLDVAAGLDFSYRFTALEYTDALAVNTIRLRYSEAPEGYIFVRIMFREDGKYAVSLQIWTGEWVTVETNDVWYDAATSDNTWQIQVSSQANTLTFTICDNAGTILGKHTMSELSDSFADCENLELMFCTEGYGLGRLSDFNGLPEIYSPDLRSEPFEKIVAAGDLADSWIDALLADIGEYQNKVPTLLRTAMTAEAILAENADMILIANGMTDVKNAVSAEAYAATLSELLEALRLNSPANTVIVVTGLPYSKEADVAIYSAYNAAIRAVASENDALYADLYRAQSQGDHTVNEDGTFSEVGSLLAAGEVLRELLRNCTCLAVNATTQIKITASTPVVRTEAALDAFRSASTAEAMREALEDAHLGVNIALYRAFSEAVREKVIVALLALDRSSIGDFEAADALVNAVSMQIGQENPCFITRTTFKTYVAVGDSISYGETAVDKVHDGWVPRLAALIEQAQGQPLTLINKAISGTRMCTVTDNRMFPAAKDTVQEYIIDNAPDLITISYGINDLHAGTTLDEFIATYRGYLAEVVQGCPNAVIMVCGLSAKGGDADSATLQVWNAAIQALAEEFGLIYNDSYQDTRGVEWLLSDGLHPTNAGYRVMANAAFRTLCAHVDLNESTGDEVPDNTQPEPSDPATGDPISALLRIALLTASLIAIGTIPLLARRKRS